MEGIVCDKCGKSLLVDEDVRYVVDIRVIAQYDPMEITSSDLKKNFEKEREILLKKIEGMTEEELNEEIYKEFRFDLCLKCKKKYLKNPLSLKKTKRKK